MRWNDEAVALLRLHYPDMPMPELSALLGRHARVIYSKAYALELKRSAEYMASPAACRLRRGDNVGAANQFKKGNRSWNHGQSGYYAGGRSADTQFSKGTRPHNWRPVGFERVTFEGYLYRKVRDTGVSKNDWQAVHTLLWIEHHGPLPEGLLVVFKDGNKNNIVIDNLELVSRAQLMARNTIHQYPPELADLMRVIGKVKRAVKKHE